MKKILLSLLALIVCLPIQTSAADPYKYAFQFKIVPALCEKLPGKGQGQLLQQILNDPSILNALYAESGDTSPFPDGSITVSHHQSPAGDIIVWTYPMPEESPLCLYQAFVPDGDTMNVYTLEKSVFVPWMVGKADTDRHSSYTDIENCALPEDFVNILVNIGLAVPDTDVPAASGIAYPTK